ncbi:hypothetical protein BOO69_04765 [Sulfitobacter alexandrii]|uniref:Tail fiber domain-containing protein n=1 Tax=Sulfitobacter alexandrii TaxID=1917485 RepID=A0A1J0WER5_9RHOB|nr:TMF family protein [Sulfitobacter alexandrii]APE42809.1 hypothetical protein BOO69_04765 [Sulfitobacter alexandrii]
MISFQYIRHFRSIPSLAVGLAMSVGAAQADQVIPDDLIVVRDLCVGSAQCEDGEAFGNTDLKIKSFSPQLQFFDTSIGAPSWSILTNRDSLPGFTIQHDDSGRTPFEVAPGAATNTLFLGNTFKVGIGTSVPEANLDISGQNPTVSIRLKNNAWTQGGFSLNVDSLGVFLKDENDGRTPFAVDTGAPTDSLYIRSDGKVGLGTFAPQEKLHIVTTTPNTDSFALFDAQGAGSDSAFRIRQNGTIPTTWEFRNQQSSGRLNVGIAGGNTPFKIDNTAANNLLRLGRNGRPDEVVVTGTLVVNNTEMNVPDYVFADDYALRPLAEVRAFIDANSHLPEVPSEAEIRAEGVDLTQMQMTLLKKVEELTLYTLEQDATIADLKAKAARSEAQAAKIEALEARLTQLEATR